MTTDQPSAEEAVRRLGLHRDELSDTDYDTLCAIADYYPEARPGVLPLAAELGISERTMERRLHSLEARGLIVTQRTHGDGKAQARRWITIFTFPPFPAPDDHDPHRRARRRQRISLQETETRERRASYHRCAHCDAPLAGMRADAKSCSRPACRRAVSRARAKRMTAKSAS